MSERIYYGGQAVIEGVMMRGKRNMVTVVRRPDNSLATDVRPLASLFTGKLRMFPLIRGIIVLIEALVLGVKVLFYSANVALEEEKTELSGTSTWLIMSAALVFAVGIFFLVPLFLTRLMNAYIPSSIVFNLIEGVIRLAIFLAYLKAVSMMSDIKRVFAYHGAEHKAVNAYEAGVPLEVESIRNYSTAHVRCGTSFLFIVMVVAILVFSLLGRPSLWVMVTSRILLLPVIAALSYEVTHFAGKHTGNKLVRAILAPGLWLQTLTTRPPDDSQIEVAAVALKKVTELDSIAESETTANTTS